MFIVNKPRPALKNIFKLSIILLFLLFINLSAQSYYGINPDTVKAQKFDMGKMWTFENFPLDYIEQEYGFRPSEELLEKFQKSALKFGNGCSGSFVSEDGLIMTNHHCVRGILPNIQKDDENLLKNGFYAKSSEEERAVPNLKVEQLIIIKDVTREIQSAMDEVKSDANKI
ncbi:MAG: S46 family peptidase, partial [Ignavibacteriaceae bacterium]|nr:S46 family peptidase [Ignavibacteriaceae bacterium]